WSGSQSAGVRYNPTTDQWNLVSTNNAPSPRSSFTAVWSGKEMIVWGGIGSNQTQPLNTGGRYNPLTDSWLAIAANPTGRTGHTAVWTGSEMIIWGGKTNAFDWLGGRPNSDRRFNLGTGNLTPTS